MEMLFAMTRHTGLRLAEVGFLLMLIAGVWLAIAEALDGKWQRFRLVVSGVLLAVAGLLLIVATHWGKFG